MNPLTGEQFAEFFMALHGYAPYSWQIRLSERAIQGHWPGAIDLPTGSGKTACIDVALFALAVQAGRNIARRAAPRRIFFCVNRRVIVDEAYDRARQIASKLWKAEKDGKPTILRDVAQALRTLAGTTEGDDSPPLDVLELRGGIYRDNRWARSPAQPTVICATIDQLGSRLLFRGYGVSPNAAPIQAALVAYDSLVLLDEAHISEPFRQTLGRVRDYLDPARWAEESIGVRPMIVVPMTATPKNVDPEQVIRLDEKDRENGSLRARLQAIKRVSLEQVRDVAKAIVENAERLAESGTLAIGIIVNRIATAKHIYEQLKDSHDNVHLVIGAMRPIDRDDQSKQLAELVGKERPKTTGQTSLIISTQCLECGADYDFDILLTECASLDALRQRFGRLNRGGRVINGGSHGVIFIREKDVKTDEGLAKDDPGDPIYGKALAKTWNWLWSHAEVAVPPETQEVEPKTRKGGQRKPAGEARTIDFGIDAFQQILKEAEGGRLPRELLAPTASLNAPVMLPAYPDFWCQTSPRPLPDPDVSLFIHGKKSEEPDVQVCWRADLTGENDRTWPEFVALLPPTTSECMSVPFSRVRDWLNGMTDKSSNASDLLEIDHQSDAEPEATTSSARRGVLWRGPKKSPLLSKEDKLRPGDTLVLPITVQGWAELGHIPGVAEDCAEAAFQLSRGKSVLRLHPSLFPTPPCKAIQSIFDCVAPPNRGELETLLKEAVDQLEASDPLLSERLKYLVENGFSWTNYPDERSFVLTSRKRFATNDYSSLLPLDEGEDETSFLGGGSEVELKEHTKHVRDTLDHLLALLPMAALKDAYLTAAELHDWGKADDRFQAILRGTNRIDAWLFQGDEPSFLAKSADGPNRARKSAGHGLPDGFRHEMLSVQLAERQLAVDHPERDLILHLDASHHGRARPFAPVILDEDPPGVSYGGVSIAANDRQSFPPHRLDSGVADRFWTLTRRFGWWGLAYLETLLRLADQQASANESAGKPDQETSESEEASQ